MTAKAIVAVTLAAAAFLACDKSPVERNGDPQLTLSPDGVVVGVYESSPLIATGGSIANSCGVFRAAYIRVVVEPFGHHPLAAVGIEAVGVPLGVGDTMERS